MRLRARVVCALTVLALVLIAVLASIACGNVIAPKYEYEEEVYLSIDGKATVYVNSSLPALNALRGTAFDASPATRVDTAAVRAYYSGPATQVIRVSQSRRSNRRFVHIRLEIADITRLGDAAPFAWSQYRFTRDGNLFKYLQTVGAAAGAPSLSTLATRELM